MPRVKKENDSQEQDVSLELVEAPATEQAEKPVDLITVFVPEKGKYEIYEEVTNGVKNKYTQVNINGHVTRIPAGKAVEVHPDVAAILGQL